MKLTVKPEEAAPIDPLVWEMMAQATTIELRGPFAWITKLEAVFSDDRVVFYGTLLVPDRDTGDSKSVCFSNSVQLHYRPIAEVVRDALLDVLKHELEENMYLGDVRVLDPHKIGT